MMKPIKIALASVMLVGNLTMFIPHASAQKINPNSKRTMWNVVNSSLTDLLNDGWKLITQSSDRAAIATGGGVGAFDEQTFSFMLFKNGKYIICLITDPRVAEGAYSKCRLLN